MENRLASTASAPPPFTPKIFILDVDGVLTDGGMYYSDTGKVMKRFGADDHDALRLLTPFLDVRFCSGDKAGFPITRRRVADHMKFPLDLVSTTHRLAWIAERYAPAEVIYMGDGIFDGLVLDGVGYGIAPANAMPYTRSRADFVTASCGGHGAVAEACLHVLARFFGRADLGAIMAERMTT